MFYVHIPFCRSFCRYCGFYSEAVCGEKDGQAFERFKNSLLEEISSRESEIKADNSVKTLYIGGGTPSVMPLPFFIELATSLPPGPYDEFTVEVNPDDITLKGIDFAKGLRDLGVNRISMGIQSLNDRTLQWMNRRHDSSQALKAYEILRKAGFDNISLDIIFGTGKDEDLDGTLSKVIDLAPEHISAYQLSLDEESILYDEYCKGVFAECDEAICENEYRLISEKLAAAGYDHYEISNWAKRGRRALHNSNYWTRTPYVGLGPSAHSLTIASDGCQTRSWNSREPYAWKHECEILGEREIREEKIMLGLRTSEGIDALIVENRAQLEKDLHEGLLVASKGRVRIPEDKFFVSDAIIRDLI